jgi:hypothetical protein
MHQQKEQKKNNDTFNVALAQVCVIIFFVASFRILLQFIIFDFASSLSANGLYLNGLLRLTFSKQSHSFFTNQIFKSFLLRIS